MEKMMPLSIYTQESNQFLYFTLNPSDFVELSNDKNNFYLCFSNITKQELFLGTKTIWLGLGTEITCLG